MISSIGNAGSTDVSYNIKGVHEKLLKKVDANGDGSVSKEEFVSSRPRDVSEEDANDMWSKLDSIGKGSLTGSEFLAAMSIQGPPPGVAQGPTSGESGERGSPGISTPATDSATSELLQALLEAILNYAEHSSNESSKTPSDASQRFSDLFAKLDTNADGSVSKDEFVSNRPRGVSEELASDMWSRLDTSGSGSLTEAQFVSAMSTQELPLGPPPAESLKTTDSSTTPTASNELVQALLEAVRNYMQSSNAKNQALSANSVSSYA